MELVTGGDELAGRTKCGLVVPTGFEPVSEP